MHSTYTHTVRLCMHVTYFFLLFVHFMETAQTGIDKKALLYGIEIFELYFVDW